MSGYEFEKNVTVIIQQGTRDIFPLWFVFQTFLGPKEAVLYGPVYNTGGPMASAPTRMFSCYLYSPQPQL